MLPHRAFQQSRAGIGQAEPAEVWHDRLREMKALRAQGKTLAGMGKRFGLSAERVQQILRETQVQHGVLRGDQTRDWESRE
jgi:hypothetical protein